MRFDAHWLAAPLLSLLRYVSAPARLWRASVFLLFHRHYPRRLTPPPVVRVLLSVCHGPDLISNRTLGAWSACSPDGVTAWKRPEPTKWAVVVILCARATKRENEVIYCFRPGS